MAAQLPNIDTSQVGSRRALTRNLNQIIDRASPQTQQEGRLWYPKVNEAVQKGIRGSSMSPIHGAGIVAAVSPNMDWDKRNIDAFKELGSLKENDWHNILVKGDRSKIQGMGINSASDQNLAKAYRIQRGEHPDTVLPRQTAPKTNSFAHNIDLNDPSGFQPDPRRTTTDPVTIDGRAHDVAANRMQGWEQGRGIGSADRRRPTRYEHFEDSYRSAARAHDMTGYEAQSVAWVQAKKEERMGTTKSGAPRKQGPARHGQSYTQWAAQNG